VGPARPPAFVALHLCTLVAEVSDGMGAQWKLRRTLALTDQSHSHHDASVRARVY
jgi:hypothetical protein